MDFITTVFKETIYELFPSFEDVKLSPIKRKDITDPDWLDQIESCHKKLGGVLEQAPLTVPKSKEVWQVNDHWVTFDTPIHFNQYRMMTLRGGWLKNFSWVEKQKTYCRKNQQDCKSQGTHWDIWTSETAEKFFGEPSQIGVFDHQGPVGWKFRAYQDMLLDINASLHSKKLTRIAYWDMIMTGGKLTPLGTLLTQRRNDPVIEKYLSRVLALS